MPPSPVMPITVASNKFGLAGSFQCQSCCDPGRPVRLWESVQKLALPLARWLNGRVRGAVREEWWYLDFHQPDAVQTKIVLWSSGLTMMRPMERLLNTLSPTAFVRNGPLNVGVAEFALRIM